MSGAGKGIRGASLAHALLFLPSLLSLPGSRLSGEGASSIWEGGAERAEGALPCVPLRSTKPTRCGVGIFKIRGTKEAGDDVRIDPVGRRVASVGHKAPGITPAQWRHV